MKNEKKHLRVFGVGLAILAALCLRKYWHQGGLLPSILILGITFLWLDLLKPVYKVWMKIAYFIGGIMTAMILTIVFFLIFGLVGIFLRMLRKDLLDKKIERDKDSYWIDSRRPFDKKQLTQQF